MSKDLSFEILPNGVDKVQVKIQGLNPKQETLVDRPLPPIDVQAIDSFRRSSAKKADIELLSKSVSEWLIGQDLGLALDGILANKETLRFVFTIAQTLQTAFADWPLELARPDPADINSDPFAVHQKVTSFVHILPKVGIATDSSAIRDFPLRILIVRSNPTNLKGLVPPAGALKAAVDALSNRFPKGMVVVDILSRENGKINDPTWENFQKAVETTPYEILVYLGHGDIQQGYSDVAAMSLLQFESPDGQTARSINSKQIANLLRNAPIPVVVLAGCLTASQNPGDEIENLPIWMRGNQGMAQALINSQSGVLLSVGMRCQIDAGDAKNFLEDFFDGLFDNGGHVEKALRRARGKMFQRTDHPPYWAAPMIFSSQTTEPIFEYLGHKITFQMTDMMKMLLDFRLVAWRSLASLPPGAAPADQQDLIDKIDLNLESEVLKQGAMILPVRMTAQTGSSITVSVVFSGNLSFSRLRLQISGGSGLKVTKVRPTQLLTDAGFEVATFGEPKIFEIQLPLGAAGSRPVPKGAILEIGMDVAADAASVSFINLEVVSADAVTPFWPGSNAVIVQRSAGG